MECLNGRKLLDKVIIGQLWFIFALWIIAWTSHSDSPLTFQPLNIRWASSLRNVVSVSGASEAVNAVHPRFLAQPPPPDASALCFDFSFIAPVLREQLVRRVAALIGWLYSNWFRSEATKNGTYAYAMMCSTVLYSTVLYCTVSNVAEFRVWLGDLPHDLNEQRMWAEFSAFGPVLYVVYAAVAITVLYTRLVSSRAPTRTRARRKTYGSEERSARRGASRRSETIRVPCAHFWFWFLADSAVCCAVLCCWWIWNYGFSIAFRLVSPPLISL